MRLRNIYLFSAIVLASIFSGFKESDYTLLLKSGEYQLEKGNLMQSLQGPAINNAYYRIIQFYRVPGQAEKAEMQKLGIVFFDYLPKNAFLVSIPKSISKQQLDAFNIRSIATLTPKMKLTKLLSFTGIPEWALNGDGTAKFVVGFFNTLPKAQIERYLTSLNATYTNKGAGFYNVTVAAEALENLSKSNLSYYVQEADPKGEPETFRARSNHRTNTMQQNFPGGMNYDGSGILVAIGDDGNLFSHVDYTGRLTYQTPVLNGGNHGEMVAGIVFGAGNINPPAKGMASGAEVAYFDYFDNGSYYLDGADTMYANMGAVITQSSYSNGTNQGYTQLCRQMDEDIIQNSGLMHVFSAGNAGTANAGYGAGFGWGNITGGHKQGKNVIATANLTWDDGLNSSSSRGPAHDGRVKPDMGAVGTSVLTTDENNGYRLGGGTSSAAPGVSGTLANLYQAYKENNAQTLPDGGLMKAILMNTAEDLGNPGPDFYYGYGRINGMRAVEVVENNTLFTGTIAQGATDTISINVGANIAEMRVMLYWSDAPASVNTSRALVNNLDLVVQQGANSWQPWVLDPTPNPVNLSANAVRATDSLNNAEQVTLANPSTGLYKLVISGSTIPSGPQKYYVVYSLINDEVKVTHPMGGEYFAPGEQQIIRWDAPQGTGTFDLDYSTDNGISWNTITTGVAAGLRYYLWTLPITVTGEALVRVRNGRQVGQSTSNFSIIGIPQNLDLLWACQDSMMLSWDTVPGATHYEVSRLGQKYMDSVGTTTLNYFKFTGINANSTYWLSVKARGPNGCVGERAYAYEKAPGTRFCNLDRDALVSEILAPAATLPSCQPLTNQSVTIKLRNGGKQALYNIPVAYQFANNTVVRDTILDTLAQGMSMEYTFSTGFNVPGSGSYSIQAFTDIVGDQNTQNDVSAQNLNVSTSNFQALPYSENFSSFVNCGTSNNCEGTTCNLSNGWYNAQNLVEDDFDFRTNSGGTPSAGTGPTSDHTTGTGKYVYIETSGACDFKEGLMLTPCFDLSTITMPEASIWYHMLGNSMGELHVDVLADGEWFFNVVNPIEGDQGANWQQLKIDLTAFSGKTVNIRFRGISGGSWRSDIALDDFEIYENLVAPSADFSSNSSLACLQSPVVFTDLSQSAPTAWAWSITPTTFNFVNGTNANSQNPEISFNALGSYSVKLVVTNALGTDSIAKSNFITSANASLLPIQEDFSGTVPAVGWSIANPDSATTWVKSSPIIGADNTSTNALTIDNYNYNALGAVDLFQTPPLDLNNLIDPYLTFDVAYAKFNNSSADALRIELSTDCGQTFNGSAYSKRGSTLATVSDQTTPFSPASNLDWRNDTLDLSPYINNNVVVRFVAESGLGNSLYLDNINLQPSVSIGLKESKGLKERVFLAPNPASNLVWLKADFKTTRSIEIKVVDASGKLLWQDVWSNAAQGNDYTLNFSAFAEGMYFVKLKSKQDIATKRVVIRR
jgi:PKD repeat protein